MTFENQTTKPNFTLLASSLQFAAIGLSVYALGGASTLQAEMLNQTQTNSADTVLVACMQGGPNEGGPNELNFQNRCNALVGESGVIVDANNIPRISLTMDQEAITAIREISPEQTIAPGTQATLANASQATTVATTLSSRLYALREGMEGTRYAGLQLYRDGKALSDGSSSGQKSFYETGGAGDDDFDRLSFWANGSYNFGSVESTFEEIGFQYDNWGVTTGVDYRFTDNLIFGGAFSYLSTDANIAHGGGRVDSDSYTGSVYGTFFVTDGFYIEGIASYGESEFEIDRDIRYVLDDPTLPQGRLDTTTKGSPDGDQYSFGLGTGYNFSIDALSIEPYARFNYLEFTVDSYSESGGLGWAQHFSEQRVRSATTSLGAQAAYALSVPFGVVVSQLHGEWVHEYKDNTRKYSTFFLGDGNATPNIFRVQTDGPDRNYGIVGIAFSTTFAYGISAFLSYDALVGYEDISSHKFTLGTRFEF